MTRIRPASVRSSRLLPLLGCTALAAAFLVPTPAGAAGAGQAFADAVVYSDSSICAHAYLSTDYMLNSGVLYTPPGFTSVGELRLTKSCDPNAQPVYYGPHAVAMRVIYWYWDGSSWQIYQNSDWLYGGSTWDVLQYYDATVPWGFIWAVTLETYIYRPGFVTRGVPPFNGSPSWKGGYLVISPLFGAY